MEEQVVSIFASTPPAGRESWIRQLELTDIQRYEREMLAWMRSSKRGILDAIRTSGKFEDSTRQQLVAALDEFAKIFEPTAAAGSKATEAA
jgi:F-type H+-transporting ATPase subunit alpha